MVRKSNHIDRASVIERLGGEVQSGQEATDEVDEAAARVLGLNRTDMRSLGVIAARASALSDRMTTVLDRLEDAGYVRRVRDLDDRRGVRVELTDRSQREIARIWGPIVKDGQQLIAKFSTPELVAICRFLEGSRVLQKMHAERIRKLAESPTRR